MPVEAAAEVVVDVAELASIEVMYTYLITVEIKKTEAREFANSFRKKLLCCNIPVGATYLH